MNKFRLCRTRWVLSLLPLWLGIALPAYAGTAYTKALAATWIQRLAATMEEHASASDVDRLLELYKDDAVYEHPQAGARFEGKASLREGISSHLRETRSPRIRITKCLFGEAFAVIEFNVKLEFQRDSKWLPMERRQVVVLEIQDSHIARIIDHWGQ